MEVEIFRNCSSWFGISKFNPFLHFLTPLHLQQPLPLPMWIAIAPLLLHLLEASLIYIIHESPREIRKGEEIAWYADGSIAYAYDRVFGHTTTTRHVYDVAAQHVVNGAMAGINGTIFAYGVTSSGKTRTMHKILSQEKKIQKLNELDRDLRRQLLQCGNENQVELTELETELDQLLLRGV